MSPHEMRDGSLEATLISGKSIYAEHRKSAILTDVKPCVINGLGCKQQLLTAGASQLSLSLLCLDLLSGPMDPAVGAVLAE